MWKLFAMVMVMSDTGSVAMSNVATDFMSRDACQQAAAQLYPESIERDVNGHHISIRAQAQCRPDGQPAVTVPIPPPFAQFFRPR